MFLGPLKPNGMLKEAQVMAAKQRLAGQVRGMKDNMDFALFGVAFVLALLGYAFFKYTIESAALVFHPYNVLLLPAGARNEPLLVPPAWQCRATRTLGAAAALASAAVCVRPTRQAGARLGFWMLITLVPANLVTVAMNLPIGGIEFGAAARGCRLLLHAMVLGILYPRVSRATVTAAAPPLRGASGASTCATRADPSPKRVPPPRPGSKKTNCD
jgi:uncharacterized membrane protein